MMDMMMVCIISRLFIDIKGNKRYEDCHGYVIMLTKIKTKFTENEQQIFVASLCGFLNYDSKMDFVMMGKYLKY